METSIPVEPYTPIPRELTVPVDQLEKTVASYVRKHAVSWVYKRRVEYPSPAPQSEANQQGNARKRQRFHPEMWYQEYVCHMEGEKRIREQSTGKNGAPKEVLKRSKKQGCTAKLKATVYKSDPTKVVLTTINNHSHVIGSLEDLQYLPLSDEVKVLIETRLREGFRKRETRFSIQQSFARYVEQNFTTTNLETGHFRPLFTQIVHRDQMVHAEEIHNIYKRIQEKAFVRHSDVRESIKLWLDGELKDKGFYTFLGDNFTTAYSFGFVSPWQARLLVVSASVCLDATHCVANVENGILYTVVVRHPLTGTGCPVAYFFTNDHSMVALRQFLFFLRDAVGLRSLSKITIDMSTAELNAIRSVWPTVDVQWCLFHVCRAWIEKTKTAVTLGSTAANTAMRRNIHVHLKGMMYEKNEAVFQEKLLKFYEDFASCQTFLTYFKRNYIENDAFKRWVAAYQPQVFTNMETNNYVESWHNQLKSNYLQRKSNRRVDRLIWILVNDVEHDFKQNIDRIQLSIGRMGPAERRRREREMKAETINEVVMGAMVREPESVDVENICYEVDSFTVIDQRYEILVQNGTMRACTCTDFTWNKIACKHMYLLRRLHRTIAIYEESDYIMDIQPYPVSNQINNAEPYNSNNAAFDDVIDRLASILATCRVSRHTNVSEADINELSNHINGISAILSREAQIAPNTNLPTQRR